jgi:transposase
MSGDRATPSFDMVATTRRRWSEEQKRAIVGEIAAAGGSVSEVARRHRVQTSLLFRWRRELRVKAQGGALVAQTTRPKFLPVSVAPPATSAPGRNGVIEIAIAGGRTVRVCSDVDTAGLVRIIAALEERR